MINTRHINKDFNLQILQVILKRNWFWPVIFPVFFFSLGYIYLRYTKSVYESSAIIQIQDNDQGKEVLELENINSKKSLSSNIELLKSPVLFENAIKKLDLAVGFFNKGSILTSQIYQSSSLGYKSLLIKDSSIIGQPVYLLLQDKNLIKYQSKGKVYVFPFIFGELISTPHFEVIIDGDKESFSSSGDNDLYFIIQDPALLTRQMMSSLKIIPLNPEAQTIEIKFESHNANLSRDVVNVIIDEFFAFDEMLKKQSSENVLNFLNNQLDSLAIELNKARDSIVFFQQKNKLNNPDNVADQLIQKIDEANEESYLANNNLSTLKDLKRRINSTSSEAEISNILIEIANEEYSGIIRTQIETLQEMIADRDILLNKVQKSNPEITIKEKQIEQKIREIKKSIEVLEKKYDRTYSSAIEKRNALELEYILVPEKKIEFSRLKSTEDLFNKYYSMLMEKKTQYAISNAGYQPGGRILSKAVENFSPVKPKVSMIYALCIVLGGIIGVIIIFLKYITYNEIDSAKDIVQLLKDKVNILGELPIATMNSEYSQIKIKKNKNTRIAEILRGIRSNIQFINPDYKTISVTSSVSGEGKTFVALNLATIISYSGKKVIILDLDLRKPKIHLAFNAANNVGVTNYLIHQNTLEECIKKTDIENLDLMTSGSIPPNPNELILKKEYDQLISELSKHYDAIIIDTPPVGIVSDGISIMSKADIPIYVFRANYSKRDYVERVEEIISLLKFNSVNVIVNGVNLKKSGFLKNVKNDYIKNYYIDDEE